MRNRIAISSIAVAIVAVSCGGGESTGEPPGTPAAGPTTTVVAADIGGDTQATAQSQDAESGSDTGLPDELVAPGAVFSGEGSSGIMIFTSTASFDETVAHYEAVLGEEPVDVGGEPGVRVASFLADTPVEVLVQVQEGDGELLIYITLTG